MKKKFSEETRQAVLSDYECGELTTQEISKKHGVSQATITVWVTQTGMKLRIRGRRKEDHPSPLVRRILKLWNKVDKNGKHKYTQAKIAAKHDLHKQVVHRMIKRWRNYMPATHFTALADAIREKHSPSFPDQCLEDAVKVACQTLNSPAVSLRPCQNPFSRKLVKGSFTPPAPKAFFWADNVLCA